MAYQKIYLIENFDDLPPGIYEGFLTYNPNTSEPFYIVRVKSTINPNLTIKYKSIPQNRFVTLKEWRENRLNKLEYI
jgi:hypothetical protein